MPGEPVAVCVWGAAPLGPMTEWSSHVPPIDTSGTAILSPELECVIVSTGPVHLVEPDEGVQVAAGPLTTARIAIDDCTPGNYLPLLFDAVRCEEGASETASDAKLMTFREGGKR